MDSDKTIFLNVKQTRKTNNENNTKQKSIKHQNIRPKSKIPKQQNNETFNTSKTNTNKNRPPKGQVIHFNKQTNPTTTKLKKTNATNSSNDSKAQNETRSPKNILKNETSLLLQGQKCKI
jgi:hypothetical protein